MSSALPAAGQRISLRTFAALGPAQLLQSLLKRRDAGLPVRTVRDRAHEHADLPHPFRLLRVRRDRPCCHAAEEASLRIQEYARVRARESKVSQEMVSQLR
jgi:hypothetical protein